MEIPVNRRIFALSLLSSIFTQSSSFAHSPWGQYQVYRKKHLLILSSRDDEFSYPFSKELVSCLDKELPESKARPARAIHLSRAFDLLRTNQFQFALFHKKNIELMRFSSGDFAGRKPVDLKTLLNFGEMQFVARHDFPTELAAIVTHHVIKCNNSLSISANLNQVTLDDADLHPGAKEAIEVYLSNK